MEILEIANKIKKAGGKLYLVGGAIRDKLLGRSGSDEDYCVTGLEISEFQKLFPDAHIRGKKFGVFEIDKKEFALARKETKLGNGHTGFKIKNEKEITIYEDLERRDITINSIAQDVLTGEIIDPFNGIKDIKNKTIKATSKHFVEDPLRVYRVARFAAELEFIVEKETIEMMNELKSELKYLSKERVFKEFKKALSSNKPSLFFNVLKEAQVMEIHFKPFFDLIGALQPEKYHPEGDSYNHTMISVDKSVKMTNKLEIRFATLVHDLGKGTTPKEEYPHHYGHEQRGAKIVSNFSKELCVPKKWERCGKIACIEHMRGGIFYKMKPSKKVEFIERVEKSSIGLEGLQIVVNCDKSYNNTLQKEQYEFAEIGERCLNEVNAKMVSQKYKLEEGILLGNKLYEERIKWMKAIEK